MSIDAVLFDFDGTLTRPDAIDFAALRASLGVPPGSPILEFIASLPSALEQERRLAILQQWEEAAARASVPNTGAEEVLALLRGRGCAVGILTRNTRRSIELSLGNFRSTWLSDFAAVVTREAKARPKPEPDGVHIAAALLRVEPSRMLVVGDFVYDIAAGRAAGAATVLITNGADAERAEAALRARVGPATPIVDAKADHVIATLFELPALLDR